MKKLITLSALVVCLGLFAYGCGGDAKKPAPAAPAPAPAAPAAEEAAPADTAPADAAPAAAAEPAKEAAEETK